MSVRFLTWGIDCRREPVLQALDDLFRPQAIIARRNGLGAVCRFETGDVFERLRQQDGKGYDTVILDPPAFVKSRKKLPEAIRGYLTVNRRAMERVLPGGHLLTCSCSHHLDRETFLGLLRQAARQALDHPVLLACPETEYLKCVILQLL